MSALTPDLERAQLEEYERLFKQARGDRRAGLLFITIRFCGSRGIALPEWAVDEFFHATNAWFALRAGSLDEAFGATPTTEKRLAQRRASRLLALKVGLAVHERQARGQSIDWQALSRKLGASKTALQDLYYGRKARGRVSRKFGRKRGMTKRK